MMSASSAFHLVLNVSVSLQVCSRPRRLRATRRQGPPFLPSENILALRASFVLHWFTTGAEDDLMQVPHRARFRQGTLL